MDDEPGDLYPQAVTLVLEHQKASTSWLQRQLRIGYNSAARYIERMEAEGFVGRPDHVGRREVLRPPSATLPGSSVAPDTEGGANPWERQAGRYDRPTSSGPAPPPGELRVPEFAGVTAIAAELVERFGEDGARAVVDAVTEAKADVDRAGDETRRRFDSVSADHLRQIIERVETLFGQRDELAQTIRDTFGFAKDIGFDPAAIRATVKARAADKDKRLEFEATLEVYRHAMGVEAPDFVIELPTPSVPPPPPSRKLTAKEKAYRETLAWSAATGAVLSQ